MIFDGKAFASELENTLSYKVRNLVKRPKVVSVLLGDDPASVLYTKLKKAAAERLGITFEIYDYTNEPLDHLKDRIAQIGARADITGVMVQLPIRGLQGQALQEVLRAIPLSKDVDGLRWQESGIMPASVRAVLSILDEIAKRKVPNSGPESSEPLGVELWKQKFVVVGSKGAVGRPLVHYLRERGVEVSEVEWDTPNPGEIIRQGEVVISCTGKEGVITSKVISEGAVVIDVGSPRGEMTAEVYQKASVAVPVPNGVGPVTIVSLLANAEEIYDGRSYARFKLGSVGGSSSF